MFEKTISHIFDYMAEGLYGVRTGPQNFFVSDSEDPSEYVRMGFQADAAMAVEAGHDGDTVSVANPDDRAKVEDIRMTINPGLQLKYQIRAF